MAFKESVYKILECIKKNPTFDGQEKWVETRLEGIKVCIARIIGKKGTPSSNAAC